MGFWIRPILGPETSLHLRLRVLDGRKKITVWITKPYYPATIRGGYYAEFVMGKARESFKCDAASPQDRNCRSYVRNGKAQHRVFGGAGRRDMRNPQSGTPNIID